MLRCHSSSQKPPLPPPLEPVEHRAVGTVTSVVAEDIQNHDLEQVLMEAVENRKSIAPKVS